jgi:5-methylcytosine-specific restriction protein A
VSVRRNDRRHFTRKVMSARYDYARECCEACGASLRPGHFDFHHEPPWEIARDSRFQACRVLCDLCHDHRSQTRDIPWIAKANRQRDKHRGAMERSRTPLPCGKNSRLKKQVGGRIIPRVSQGEKLRAYLRNHGRVVEDC